MQVNSHSQLIIILPTPVIKLTSGSAAGLYLGTYLQVRSSSEDIEDDGLI